MNRQWNWCAVHGHTAVPCRCRPAAEPVTMADVLAVAGLVVAVLVALVLVGTIGGAS